MKLLQALETFGKDALKDIEIPVTSSQKFFLIVSHGSQDAPEVATVVQTVLEKALTLGTDVTAAVAADGLNIAEDAKVLADGKDLFTYVQGTAIPVVEKVWSDLGLGKAISPATPAKPAVLASVVDGPSTAPTTTVQQAAAEEFGRITAGPGLHNVVKP